MKMKLVGEIDMSTDLYETLIKNIPNSWESEIKGMIGRHHNKDWGDVDQGTVDQNNSTLTIPPGEEDQPVFVGGRPEGLQLGLGVVSVVSAFHASDGTRVPLAISILKAGPLSPIFPRGRGIRLRRPDRGPIM